MINTKVEILYFLRDSMFRIGELGAQIADMRTRGIDGRKEFHIKKMLIWELMQVNAKYLCNDAISDPQFEGLHNYLDDVDEKEIIEDLHFWRERAGLNEVGYLDFPGYSTVVNYFKDDFELPDGSFGYILGWNQNNELAPVSFEDVAGDSGNLSTF